MTETNEKLVRVRKYLKEHKLDGIVLSTRSNFAWLSGGGDNHIVSQSEAGFGALAVTAKQCLLIANRIEIDRLAHEEPLAGFTPKPFPWTTSLRAALPDALKGVGKKFAADDVGATGLDPLPGDFVQDVRAGLCEHEIRRYKDLGRSCALVAETVCRSLAVGDSEHQVEADLARHLLARGIQPHVLLVAFDERIQRYRHPVPTAKHLRKHAMIVICGQRGGLIANITRIVHFGALPPDIVARHEACCRVEAALWKATVAGAAWGVVFKAGQEQYKKEGFAKEWELHHQGGPTGYAGRDFLATPDEQRVVVDRQAVAWNPSITGTKSEDTFILDGGKRHVITAASEHWPAVKVTVGGETFVRPGILVR